MVFEGIHHGCEQQEVQKTRDERGARPCRVLKPSKLVPTKLKQLALLAPLCLWLNMASGEYRDEPNG